MSRWVWPAAAGVVTSATGVAINLATDGRANPWAWVTVVLLTALGVVIALRVQSPPQTEPTAAEPTAAEPTAAEQAPAEPAATPEPRTPAVNVHNSVSGNVTGGVVQAGTLGSVTINSPTTVNQTAVARDGGTVHQAGRDIRHD